MKYVMIPALCLLSGVAVAGECKYSTDVDTSFEGVISKSQNYDKKTYPYIDDTRKCVVSMDVKINGKWHPTSGTYVFGPDMSENDACKSAELSAKENILRTTVPEKLKKTMEQKCKVNVKVEKDPNAIIRSPAPKAAPIIPVQRVSQSANNVILNGSPTIVYEAPLPGLPDLLPYCRKIWSTVWIGGRQQLAYQEVCK